LATSETIRASAREHCVNWLRVFATGLVLLFHCARFFDPENWHVKNPERSVALRVFVGLLVQWMMPLFFVLHQTVIVVIAFLPMGWPVAVPVKYVAPVATSLTTIVVIYTGLVRRWGPMRFLFGMVPIR
jgi:hypothetical protein